MTTWKDVFDSVNNVVEERLKTYQGEIQINGAYQIRGSIPNRNLAPLQLIDTDLFTGVLPLERGGTGDDLSLTGPGVAFQAASGAVFTIGDLPFPFIDFSADAGAINQILVSDGAGNATFGGVDLTSANWRSGLLPPSAGGTGVNNSTRTLTISTNSGTLSFSASGKVLTIGENITVTGASGKVLTLTNGLTVTTNDGTLAFSAASKTLTIGETITLTGSSSGLTLTVPATGTADLIGTAQTISAVKTFSTNIRVQGIDFGLSPSSDFVIRHGTAATGTLLRMSPNGNGIVNSSSFQMFNTDWNADQTNFELFTFGWNNNVATFLSQRGGTGTLRDMQFANANGSFRLVAAGYMTLTDFIEGVEITAPAAGAANTWRIYGEDNGAGKTRVMIKFNTGVAQQIAIQP